MQTRTGFVAESLVDGKKITVSLRSNVSLLSEISMYTYTEERPLVEIMKAVAAKENNGPVPNFKEDKAAMTAYFETIVSDFDKDRVYPSDIKKVLTWYNILQAKDLLTSNESTSEEKVVKATEEVKPKKVAAPKNAGAASSKKAPAVKATKSTKK